MAGHGRVVKKKKMLKILVTAIDTNVECYDNENCKGGWMMKWGKKFVVVCSLVSIGIMLWVLSVRHQVRQEEEKKLQAIRDDARKNFDKLLAGIKKNPDVINEFGPNPILYLKDQQVTAVLMDILKYSPNVEHRMDAAWGLVFRGEGFSIIPNLKEALKHEDTAFRYRAAKFLESLGEKEIAVPVIKNLEVTKEFEAKYMNALESRVFIGLRSPIFIKNKDLLSIETLNCNLVKLSPGDTWQHGVCFFMDSVATGERDLERGDALYGLSLVLEKTNSPRILGIMTETANADKSPYMRRKAKEYLGLYYNTKGVHGKGKLYKNEKK